MTKEEAKSILGDVRAYLASLASLENELLAGHSFVEICNAIKTLEQEPCEDCISRTELLKAIDTWDKFGCDADTKLVPYKDHYVPYIHYDDVIKCIKGMPSVKQEPKTVMYSGDGYADGYMVYDMAECPNCGYEYEDGDKDWGENFCPHCGRALSWESEG